MKKVRVIVQTVSANHQVYVEQNGARTLYAVTDKLPEAKDLVLKAKRELGIASAARPCFRPNSGSKTGLATRRSAALTLQWSGPATDLRHRRAARPPLHSRRVVRTMGQSFGNEFTLVSVRPDSFTSGIPKQQLWVAAAKPEQAITLVLCAVPVGWTAAIADERLTPEQEGSLNLKPGEVRELKM
jgi:hypothetical protein